MSLRRILAVMRKEFLQIARDVRSLLIIFAIPLILLFIYGYAVNLDVKHVPLCVYDRDGSQQSQDLLKAFQASEYFRIVHLARDYREVVDEIDTGHSALAIVIPPRFAEDLRDGRGTSVQAILDASDSNSASIGLDYTRAIVAAYSSRVQLDWAQSRGLSPPVPPLDVRARTWFNENLESMATFVPGVVALVMAVVGAFLTSLTIAREWERGTMEQLISTPVRALEIQIGKLVPYFLIGMSDTAVCAVMGVVWFGVPFRGSWAMLFASSALFLVVVLSLGYWMSVVAKSQLAASQLALVATFLPTFLLSGFLFPIDQMPVVVQWITRVLPARYYITILRNIFLKGTPVRMFASQLAALAIYALLLVTMATRALHKRLE
ncbi:MAG TPA: ABC transporter permease [Candidatus Acidoferrales bacterium]|nr:ABC transporter permease [Candidatus Acidoferrales bacterium]